MAIFQTAYDTSACSGFPIRKVKDKLEAARIMGAFSPDTPFSLNIQDQPLKLHLLKGGNSTADVVPFFGHPCLLKPEGVSGAQLPEFALDVRNFGKWYAPNETFVVRNRPEYLWSVRRAVLNALWLSERAEIFRDISTIPAAVYAGLISESIARRFALDAAEQITLSVVACYFYHCLFTDDKEFDEFALNKVAGNIARITRVPADKVFEIITDMKVLNSLEDLCAACKSKTGSVRLEEFNVGMLVAICSSTWFGTNARETLVVGLEHVPTWLCIVSASLNDATFKRSTLTKISMRYDKGEAAANFEKSLSLLWGGNSALHEALGLA
jgi:hypothetical protein